MVAMLAIGGIAHGETDLEKELAQYRKDLARYEQEAAHDKADRKLAEQVKKDRIKELEALQQATRQKIKDDEQRLREMEKRRDTVVDETKDVSDICPVHQRKMEATRVPIQNGMLAPMVVPWEVRQKEFPFAQKYSGSGCMWADYQPTHAKIYVCPDCVAAEKKWVEEHKEDK